jgi:hypothetical protein
MVFSSLSGFFRFAEQIIRSFYFVYKDLLIVVLVPNNAFMVPEMGTVPWGGHNATLGTGIFLERILRLEYWYPLFKYKS